jgi:catechol 2,3-dioxygenase-like lactoylglutathione lyase family enzyme
MLSYICIGTNDMARSVAFYDAVLAALGLNRGTALGEEDRTGWAGWGTSAAKGAAELELWLCRPFNGQSATAGNGTMVALKAQSWTAVQAFHAAALENGGSSEGEPGLRPQYGDDFYAAYVRDPEGNKIAAVCRGFKNAQ